MNKRSAVPPVCECQVNDKRKGNENCRESEKISRHTKIASVRAHLESGRSITPLEALRLYGSFRLGAIIYVLRERGLDIRTEFVRNERTKSRYAKYSLNPKKFA